MSRAYLRCRDGVDDAVKQVLASGQYILGPALTSFEEEFAAYLGTQHGIGVASGLDALRLALQALPIGKGDEVIVPANTFAATAMAVIAVGAKPVAADVDPTTGLLGLDGIEAALTPRTRALLPVHLYGRACEMDGLLVFAAERGLAVVEDACQAHGASLSGRRCGSFGVAGCFSFYPTKNLGCAGDGGFVATNDAGLADRVRTLRNYGQRVRYEHETGGTNSRLDSLQAAILAVRLKSLDEWNRERAELAEAYRTQLAGAGSLLLPPAARPGAHVYHLFVVQHPRRDALLRFLADRGIQAGVHYPRPIHEQPFYLDAVPRRAALPVAEALCRTVLSLPLYPGMTAEEVERVAREVRAFD